MKPLAIITGASRGIGYAIARRLASEFTIVNLSRTNPGDDRFSTIECDLSIPNSIVRAFTEAAIRHGAPKLLVNCAGYVNPLGLLEMSINEWLYTLNVNLTAPFLCTQLFTKYNRQGGMIINIASTAAGRPSPGWSAYAAAKAGLVNFSLTMSEELKGYGTKVYCISPGRCATELRKILAPEEDPAKIMQPEEIAELIYYLAVYDQVLSGQNITVRKGSQAE